MQTDSQMGADKIVWQLRVEPQREFTTVRAGACLFPIEFKGWLDGMAQSAEDLGWNAHEFCSIYR